MDSSKKQCDKRGGRIGNFVGSFVKKDFEKHGVFIGKVVSRRGRFYRVNYEDGDREDLEVHELREILFSEGELEGELKERRIKLEELLERGKRNRNASRGGDSNPAHGSAKKAKIGRLEIVGGVSNPFEGPDGGNDGRGGENREADAGKITGAEKTLAAVRKRTEADKISVAYTITETGEITEADKTVEEGKIAELVDTKACKIAAETNCVVGDKVIEIDKITMAVETTEAEGDKISEGGKITEAEANFVSRDTVKEADKITGVGKATGVDVIAVVDKTMEADEVAETETNRVAGEKIKEVDKTTKAGKATIDEIRDAGRSTEAYKAPETGRITEAETNCVVGDSDSKTLRRGRPKKNCEQGWVPERKTLIQGKSCSDQRQSQPRGRGRPRKDTGAASQDRPRTSQVRPGRGRSRKETDVASQGNACERVLDFNETREDSSENLAMPSRLQLRSRKKRSGNGSRDHTQEDDFPEESEQYSWQKESPFSTTTGRKRLCRKSATTRWSHCDIEEDDLNPEESFIVCNENVSSDDETFDSNDLGQIALPSHAIEYPLPPMQPLPQSSGDLPLPESSVPDLFSVYIFLRSFSDLLFLSPFSLENFIGALNFKSTNSLIDCVHVSLLRALRQHLEMISDEGNDRADRAIQCLRQLDWNFLDAVTWPVYLVEYILTQGNNGRLGQKIATLKILDGDYYRIMTATKLAILQFLCEDVMETEEFRTKVNIQINFDHDVDANDSKDLSSSPSGLFERNPCHSKNKGDVQKNSSEGTNSISDNSIIHNKHGYSNNEQAEFITLGVNGAEDHNSDECRLCGMDGNLVCCDGCPSVYHSRCVGVKAHLLDGDWYCPECVVSKTDAPGLKTLEMLSGAVVFGVDPYERAFFGTCGYLLVSDSSTSQTAVYRYYNKSDVAKVSEALDLSGPFYNGIRTGILQYWDMSDKMNNSACFQNSDMISSNSHPELSCLSLPEHLIKHEEASTFDLPITSTEGISGKNYGAHDHEGLPDLYKMDSKGDVELLGTDPNRETALTFAHEAPAIVSNSSMDMNAKKSGNRELLVTGPNISKKTELKYSQGAPVIVPNISIDGNAQECGNNVEQQKVDHEGLPVFFRTDSKGDNEIMVTGSNFSKTIGLISAEGDSGNVSNNSMDRNTKECGNSESLVTCPNISKETELKYTQGAPGIVPNSSMDVNEQECGSNLEQQKVDHEGSPVFFTTDCNGDNEIMVTGPNFSKTIELTSAEGATGSVPKSSMDGNAEEFVSSPEQRNIDHEGSADLYTIDCKGDNELLVTGPNVSKETELTDAHWAPGIVPNSAMDMNPHECCHSWEQQKIDLDTGRPAGQIEPFKSGYIHIPEQTELIANDRTGAQEDVSTLSLLVKSKQTNSITALKMDYNPHLLDSKSNFKPKAYINHYAPGDIAASAAANLASMNAEYDRIVNSQGGSKRTIMATMQEHVKAFSKVTGQFYWPNFGKKTMEPPKQRCGWCFSCKSPASCRRACLLNVAACNTMAGAAKVPGGIRPTKKGEGHLPAVAAYILHIEDCLHGLIIGPLENPDYRKYWRKHVEQASTTREISTALLDLEQNIRLIALMPDWTKHVEDPSSLVSASHTGASAAVPTPRRGGSGRRNQKNSASLITMTAPNNSGDFGVYWWRGGRLSSQIFQQGVLPCATAKRAGRQGGLKRIPGVFYAEGSDLPSKTRQCIWRAAVEKATSVSQLAVQVRYLDAYLKWEDLISPEDDSQDEKEIGKDLTSFKIAAVCEKKYEGGDVKYLLDFGDQTHIPISVVKYGRQIEETKESKNRYWLGEFDVPLYLVKAFERTVLQTCPNNGSKEVWKDQNRLAQGTKKKKDVFAFLISKTEMHNKYSCAHCRMDVLIRDSVKCSACEGSFHRECIVNSDWFDKSGFNFTCYKCHQMRLVQRRDTQNIIAKSKRNGARFVSDMNVQNNFSSLRVKVKEHEGICAQPFGVNAALQNHPGVDGNLAQRKKSNGLCNPTGLIWKKIDTDDGGENFRKTMLLLACENNMSDSGGPNCFLCRKDYNPKLMYVGCESCRAWFHGDAFGLNQENIVKLHGFKCHRCRKKGAPVCPYGIKGSDVRREKLPIKRPKMRVCRGHSQDFSITDNKPLDVVHIKSGQALDEIWTMVKSEEKHVATKTESESKDALHYKQKHVTIKSELDLAHALEAPPLDINQSVSELNLFQHTEPGLKDALRASVMKYNQQKHEAIKSEHELKHETEALPLDINQSVTETNKFQHLGLSSLGTEAFSVQEWDFSVTDLPRDDQQIDLKNITLSTVEPYPESEPMFTFTELLACENDQMEHLVDLSRGIVDNWSDDGLSTENDFNMDSRSVGVETKEYQCFESVISSSTSGSQLQESLTDLQGAANSLSIEETQLCNTNMASSEEIGRLCKVCGLSALPSYYECKVCGVAIHHHCYEWQPIGVWSASQWTCNSCEGGLVEGQGFYV